MTILGYALLSLLLGFGYLVLLYLPGYLLFNCLGARGSIARAASPSLSLILYALLGIVMHLIGLPWRIHFVLGALVLVLASVYVVSRKTYLRHLFTEVTIPDSPLQIPRFRIYAPLFGLLLLGAALITGTAGVVPQHSDSIFHLNGVWTITRSGNGAVTSALAPIYSLQPVSVTYPSLWHSFVALLATPTTVVVATNAAIMVLPLVWLHTISVFTDTVFHSDRGVLTYLPFIVYATPISPTVITHVIDRWPNGLGISILPGLLAISAHLIRLRFPGWEYQPRHRIAYPLLLLVLWAGASLAHPSTIVSVVVMLFPVLGYLAVQVFFSIRHQRVSKTAIRHLQILFSIAGVFAALGMGAIYGRIRAGAPESISWSGALSKIASVLSLYTYWSASIWGDIVIGFVGVFTVTGAIWLLYRKQSQWLVASYGFFLVICLGALVFIPIATPITALWFSDPLRLLATLAVFAVPLAAQGMRFYVGLITRWISAKNLSQVCGSRIGITAFTRRGIVVALVVFAIGGVAVARSTIVYRLYFPPSDWQMTQLSEGELELHERLGQKLDRTQLVLGEAANGSALLPVTAQIPVALKQQNYSSLDSDGWYLRRHFKDIRVDPSVCKLINRNHIGYFYEDDTRWFSGHWLPLRSPGLFDVDTSRGFTLIDESEGIKVWRIDQCRKRRLPIPRNVLFP